MVAADDSSSLDVDPERVAAWIEQDGELQLIDVREPYEHDAGYIEGDRHIQLLALPAQAATIDRERPVVFYCRVGSRSQMAAQALRASGYDAYSMTGGLKRWAEEGRPLRPDDGYVAEH